jgi:hypothetical protein
MPFFKEFHAGLFKLAQCLKTAEADRPDLLFQHHGIAPDKSTVAEGTSNLPYLIM